MVPYETMETTGPPTPQPDQLALVCAICLDHDVEADERLKCAHSNSFCKTCLDECVAHNIVSCPLCKQSMVSIELLSRPATPRQAPPRLPPPPQTLRLVRLEFMHSLRMFSFVFFAYLLVSCFADVVNELLRDLSISRTNQIKNQ